ncbi:MAG: tetratricopeptide repeat protein, partial [Chloroflexi bacterium]|nr:tetratricopeptide repeat protein [Chloroflexota bacterium]
MTHTLRSRSGVAAVLAAALVSTLPYGSNRAAAQEAGQIPAGPPPTGAPTTGTPGSGTPGTGTPGGTPGASPDAGAPVTQTPMSAQDQAQWAPIQAAVDKRDYPTAERLLRTWLTTHADDRHAQFLLGYALTYQNKNSEAIDTFNTLVTAEPENPDYLFGKATALVRAGRGADAIPILDHVRQIGTNTEPV